MSVTCDRIYTRCQSMSTPGCKRTSACCSMSLIILIVALSIFVQSLASDMSATPSLSDTTVKVVNRNGNANTEVTMMEVSAVRGSTVELVCDITCGPKDRVKLVLFFRNDSLIPIYSYDMRKEQSTAKRWSDQKLLQSRAFFHVESSPARLKLKNIDVKDEGLYKCRVDFKTAPTRIAEIRLSVIVPPEKPIIMDVKRREPVRLKLGPYTEGDNVSLMCHTLGGNPVPSLTWRRDHVLIDPTHNIISPGKVSTGLQLTNLRRSDLHTILTCRANNNNASSPVSTSVKLDLVLPPLSVTLVHSYRALSAGKKYLVECHVVGARPGANVTWWMGPNRIKSSERISPDGNLTVSSIFIVPTPEDNGSILSCKAETSGLQIKMEDTWLLPIQYIPKATIKLGGSINGSNIKEGDDVYFECEVFANPPPYKITWKHNREDLHPRKGVLIREDDLVLQGVDRLSFGKYTCSAHSEEGVGHSQPTLLDVKFIPVCLPNQLKVFGVGRFESANVTCGVTANPDSPLQFQWIFNSTNEPIEIQESSIEGSERWSRVNYTPTSEMEYGSLLCWAQNNIGRQEEPCIFHIVPAGRPDKLTDCVISNITYSSTEILCKSGFDGGLPQQFESVVTIMGSDQVVASSHSLQPSFRLADLSPGTSYNVTIIALNDKGQSESVTVPLMTLKEPEKQIAETRTKEGSFSPLLEIVLGTVSFILLVSAVICVVACQQCKRTSRFKEDILVEPRSPVIVMSSCKKHNLHSPRSRKAVVSGDFSGDQKLRMSCSKQQMGQQQQMGRSQQQQMDKSQVQQMDQSQQQQMDLSQWQQMDRSQVQQLDWSYQKQLDWSQQQCMDCPLQHTSNCEMCSKAPSITTKGPAKPLRTISDNVSTQGYPDVTYPQRILPPSATEMQNSKRCDSVIYSKTSPTFGETIPLNSSIDSGAHSNQSSNCSGFVCEHEDNSNSSCDNPMTLGPPNISSPHIMYGQSNNSTVVHHLPGQQTFTSSPVCSEDTRLLYATESCGCRESYSSMEPPVEVGPRKAKPKIFMSRESII